MLIAVPKEIKIEENRIGLTPGSVRELVSHGHSVLVQTGAGQGIAVSDREYEKAGAKIASSIEEVYEQAQMIVKVKEPQPLECKLIRKDQILFTYLHLAAEKELTLALMESGCTAIAYETVTDNFGRLPLLAPMSDVAGRMSIQAAAHALEQSQGGRGVLLGGVPGVEPANVVVLGGGVSGTGAVKVALGMGAQVTVLDKSVPRLIALEAQFGSQLKTLFATNDAIEYSVLQADVVIGAVLVPGASAPKLVTKAMIEKMRSGSVVVDIAIDQGGCFETSKPTTHKSPTFKLHDVIHYCVTNMPGAVPRTSTFALNNVTLPFVQALAKNGLLALKNDPYLMNGLNVHQGKLTYQAVATAFDLHYTSSAEALS